MQRFIEMIADISDRRSFLRKMGKLGMGAAVVGGVLMLPHKGLAQTQCPNGGTVCRGGHDPSDRPCNGLCPGDICAPGLRCVKSGAGETDCDCGNS